LKGEKKRRKPKGKTSERKDGGSTGDGGKTPGREVRKENISCC